jgi:predicted transcriptional regulator
MIESRTRFTLRMSRSLKDRLLTRAQQERRSASDIIESLVEQYLALGHRQQDPIESKLLELIDEHSSLTREVKNAEAEPENQDYLDLGGFLLNCNPVNNPSPYLEICQGNFALIRFKAVQDFRKGAAPWAQQFNYLTKSIQIDRACTLVADLLKKRKELDMLEEEIEKLRLEATQQKEKPSDSNTTTTDVRPRQFN